MIYAIRLGALQTGEGPANVYIGLSEQTVVALQIARSDEEGVQAVLANAGRERVLCEPALARVAKKLVLDVAEPPPWTAIPCAELSTLCNLGESIERSALAAVLPALVAACEFVERAPWRHFSNLDALDFVVERATGKRRMLEGCVLGAGGQEFGVALYDQPGSMTKLAVMARAGKMEDARELDAYGFTIDDAPDWVANAVARAFGAPVVIRPVRLRRRAMQPVSATELMTMAGAVAAAAKLTPDQREARATVGEGTEAITVTVRVRGPKPTLH